VARNAEDLTVEEVFCAAVNTVMPYAGIMQFSWKRQVVSRLQRAISRCSLFTGLMTEMASNGERQNISTKNRTLGGLR
jgi:hypothetical protein